MGFRIISITAKEMNKPSMITGSIEELISPSPVTLANR